MPITAFHQWHFGSSSQTVGLPLLGITVDYLLVKWRSALSHERSA